MDENLKPVIIPALKVEVINQPEIKKEEDNTSDEYFDIRIDDEDIDEIEVE